MLYQFGYSVELGEGDLPWKVLLRERRGSGSKVTTIQEHETRVDALIGLDMIHRAIHTEVLDVEAV